MAVAAVGIVVNGVTALLFMSGRRRDLNIRGAYLHMAADAGVSFGVVLTGLAILATGWRWLDPAVSLVISALIVVQSSNGNAEAGRKQCGDNKHNNYGERRDGRQTYESRDRITGSAANDFQIKDRGLHDLSDRESREREIDTPGAQHRDSNGKRDNAGN